jgi:PAS domain S-box-containing protein
VNQIRERFSDIWDKAKKNKLYAALALLFVLLLVVVIALLSSPKPDILTPEERTWLNQHPGIKLAPDPSYPPFEYFDEKGIYKGIIADTIHIIENQLNYKFTIVRYDTWDDTLTAVKNREVDGITAAQISTDREDSLKFTEPMVRIPIVFLNRKGESTDLTIDKIGNMTIAITENNGIHEFIEKDYPNLHLLLTKDDQEALNAVSFKHADIAIVNLSIATELIKKQGYTNLQIAGNTDQTNDLAIATRNDWPILNRIMQKGLNSISAAESQAIQDKWMGLGNSNSGISNQVWKTIFVIIIVVFLALLFVLIWNSVLRNKVAQRTNELAQSEEKYRLLVENAAEGVIVTHRTSVVFVNQTALDLTGYTREEALNVDVTKITYPDDRERVWKKIAMNMGLDKPAVYYHCRIIAKNGDVRWLSNHSVEILWEGKHAGLTLFTDVTDQRKAEEQIQRQLQHMASLRTAETAITASMDQSLTFRILLDQIIGQLGVDAADILLLNPVTQTLEFAVDQGFRTGFTRGTRLRMGRGFAWQAITERKVIQASRKSLQPSYLESPDLINEGFYSYIGTPLIVKGAVKGVLEVYHRSILNPDSEWMEFLEAIAGQAAIAIDNASLFEELQRTNLELTISYDATIEGWAHALELRDGETEGHSKRVCQMTMMLASAFNIPPEEMVHIRRGALLHDIGKMGIPDSILLKPGPLTPEEWKIMRMHPIYGRDLLAEVEHLRPALDIPFCHHERWDGTGYPQGLKREEIPLAARIFTVVDVWDALTSDRPYRSHWSTENAHRYLVEQSGKQFDPQVVDAFIRLQGLKPKSESLAYPEL